MFWGGYFGSVVDRFGIHWTFNCASKSWRAAMRQWTLDRAEVRDPSHTDKE